MPRVSIHRGRSGTRVSAKADEGAIGGRSLDHGVARSKASATRSTVASSIARPVNCRPTGRRVGGEAARHRDRRQAGQVGADGEDVRQIHLQRIVDALAEPERRRRARRHRDHVDRGEGRVVVAADQRAHLLRLQVVGVVVAGAQHVGAEHDPPLDLGAEPRAARPLVHLGRASARRRRANP